MDGVKRYGATDMYGVTQCGATDEDGDPSITRISNVLAYLKQNYGKNEILTNFLGYRKTNPLIYVKIIFLDRVALIRPADWLDWKFSRKTSGWLNAEH